MRYEKPQRGRVREHWQFNVDIFGAAPNLGEIEVLNLIVNFLTGFGATSEMFSVLLNDRRVVDAIFNDLLNLSDEEAYKLYKVIDKAKKVSAEKLDTMLKEILSDENKFNTFKQYLNLSHFDELKSFLSEHNLEETCEEFIAFTKMVNDLNLNAYIKYDPTIVRGLDYYTGIVFEIFDKHPDNNRAIAGGGAYANLLKIFNEEPLPGIGFGLGDVTLRDFLETHKLLPDLSKADNDLFIVYTDTTNETAAFLLANQLREKSLKAELNLGKIKFNKIFKLAETKGHNFVLIVEEKDGKTQAQVKNLATRDGQFFDLNNIEDIYKYIKE
jgi:histidyl-tRNA synthetase